MPEYSEGSYQCCKGVSEVFRLAKVSCVQWPFGEQCFDGLPLPYDAAELIVLLFVYVTVPTCIC